MDTVELNAVSDKSIVPVGWHLFFNEECYSKVVNDFNLLDVGCMQLLSSKVLSYGIIVISSVFVKMPQIFKILKNGSVQGISFFSQCCSLVMSSCRVTYSVAQGFPLSTWAENSALSVQILLVALLILLYAGRHQRAVAFVACYLGIMLLLLMPFTPMWLHVLLQIVTFPLGMTGKVVQIWTNLKNGSTGQLSPFSIHIQSFRLVGRLYSTVTELEDSFGTAVFALGSVLNSILSGQIIYYKNTTALEKKEY